MKPQNDIDKLFRSLSEKKEFAYKDEYWQKVAAQLPGSDKSKFLFGYRRWILSITALLLISVFALLWIQPRLNKHIDLTQNQVHDISSVNQSETNVDETLTNTKPTIVNNMSYDDANVLSKPTETTQNNIDITSTTTNQSNRNVFTSQRNTATHNKKPMPLSDNTVSITLSEPKSTSEKSDYRENTNLSFLPSRIYNFQPLESKVQKHTSPVNLHNRILSASNFLKLSAGTLFYPSIQFKNTIAPNMDISPYLQIAYVHSLNHSRHWSFNTGMGLNMLRIRGADSLIYNDTYFSFGTITFDSLQNINSSITLPPQGKRVSQEQLIQLHIPFFIIYNLNQKHSFQLGGTVFYLLNVSSKINANQTTPTASLFSNSDMEEVQTREWGYTSGIRTWQMSAGVQYEYHMSKHFSLQAGAQKMMRDLSDNSFYGNKRNTLPWLFNVGVQYRIKTKF